MNKLFVAYKPRFVSSNRFLGQLKKKYNIKKAGYSGTLDPFAQGSLIVGFGRATKLFQFLNLDKKVYKATLWLGANSETLDIENKVTKVQVPKFTLQNIKIVLKNMVGKIKYIPPKFSAKSINGERAYKLARAGITPQLKEIESEIFNIKLINYNHPFLTIEMTVSKGSYIRSFAEIIGKKLGTTAILSFLERTSEGKFTFNNEKEINPLEALEFPKNIYRGNLQDIFLGKKIDINLLKDQNNGIFILDFQNSFSIIKIQNDEVKYLLNNFFLD